MSHHLATRRATLPTATFISDIMGTSLAKPTSESSLDRLTMLSKDIEEKTRFLTDTLRAKGLEAPSFQAGGLPDFPLAETDREATKARREIVALTKELHDLVLGPRESLKNLAWDTVSYITLQAIGEFRLAEAVPMTGSISYEDLAGEVHRLTGAPILPSDLRRLLRLAMTNNLFHEPQVGFVAHNRASLLLLEDESLASWVAMYTTDLLTPVAYTVAAMKKWPESEEDNQTGVNIAYNHANSFFAHVQSDKARAKRYDLAMRSHGSREGYDVSHTVQDYPWGDLGKAVIVDMGGGNGIVSMAVAEAFPQLSFIVQDLPGTRTSATIGKVPTHLAARVSLTTHDFFNSQTEVADLYLFRHIFHAFSDKYATQILRELIPALRPGARIVINDIVLPVPGQVPHEEERSIRTMDVLMKTVCNAREREVEDWKSLFEQADKRFEWKGAWKTKGKLWFVECVWEGSRK